MQIGGTIPSAPIPSKNTENASSQAKPDHAPPAPSGSNKKLALGHLHFNKTANANTNALNTGAAKEADAQTPKHDARLGKRPRVDSLSNSDDEVAATVDPNRMETLSTYTLSPTQTPPPDDSKKESSLVLSQEEAKATNAFLARLKAKAEAAASPPQIANANAKYTPYPEKGFPTVYGRNSTHAFDNMDIVQLTDWTGHSGPRVFVQPLMHGYYTPAITAEIVSNLKATIEDLFGCVGVKVTAPMPVSKPAKLDQPPYTYLVYNITTAIAFELVKQQCWATKRIGFLVYSAETIMPTYLGALEGFNAHDEADMSSLHQLIADTFYLSEIGPIIAQISASDPQLAEMEDRIEQEKFSKRWRSGG
jgi:hypothetical protein